MAPQTGMGNQQTIKGHTPLQCQSLYPFYIENHQDLPNRCRSTIGQQFLYQEGHKSPIYSIYYRNGTDPFYFYSMQLCGFFTKSKSYLTSPFFLKVSYKSQFIKIIKSNFHFNLLYQMKSTHVIQFHTSVSNRE